MGYSFIVTINRSEAERRYVLRIQKPDGSTHETGPPLNIDDFKSVYGFHPHWPHEPTKENELGPDHDMRNLDILRNAGVLDAGGNLQ